MLEVPLNDTLRRGADLEVNSIGGVASLRLLQGPGLLPGQPLQDLGLGSGRDAASSSAFLHLFQQTRRKTNKPDLL